MGTAVLFVIAQTWGKQLSLHSSLQSTCAPMIQNMGWEEPMAAAGATSQIKQFRGEQKEEGSRTVGSRPC